MGNLIVRPLLQFVFFPECCDYVGSNRDETLKLSEPLTGRTVAEYKQLAKDSGLWMSMGGVHESIVDDSSTDGSIKSIYNTHIVIDDRGQLVASYRKLHMFNVVTPEFKFRESETVRSGSELVPPIDSPIGKLGLQIVRFNDGLVLRCIISIKLSPSVTMSGSRRRVPCCGSRERKS